MTALLLVWWLAYPGLAIDGDSACPSPAQVEGPLGQLMAQGEGGRVDSTEQHLASLSTTEHTVTIALRGSDGGLLAERTLDRGASCPELAQAVAVILAAWEATFRPSVAPLVVSPPPPAKAPPASAPAPKVVEAATVVPGAERRFTFDAGMGVLTSIAGEEAVFGARLESAIFPFARPIGLDSALSWAANHTRPTSVPGVEARWMRAAFSLGPSARWRGQTPAMLDAHAGAVLALLRVTGAGVLAKTASDISFQIGLDVGLRGLWTWSNRAAWLGANLYAYPGEDGLTIGSDNEVGRLPRLEVQLAFGISLGRFR